MTTAPRLRLLAAALLLTATVPATAFAGPKPGKHIDGPADAQAIRTVQQVLPSGVQRLTLISNVKTVIHQGTAAGITLTGTAADLARVEAIVEKDRVVIRNRGFLGRGPRHEVTAVLTLPTLVEARVAQGGALRSDAPLTGETLSVTLDGPAIVSLDAALTGGLTTTVSGPGQLSLSGQCARHTCALTGSGRVEATQMTTPTASARVLGDGDVRLAATSTLRADVTGEGRVHYVGNPALTEHVGAGGGVVQLAQ